MVALSFWVRLSDAITVDLLISSVITSVLSSLIIFTLLLLFRPRIRISRQIAKHIHGQRGTTVYTFKIHNRSIIKLIDLRVEAMLVTNQPYNGSCILKVQELNFTRSNFIRLYGFSPFDNEAKYACRLSVVDDLGQLWTNHSQHIEFIVSARHPWSGLNRWFIRKYYLPDAIVEGEFETKRSMAITKRHSATQGQ